METPIPQPNIPTIVITFDPANGSISVNGAIENKLLAFGLLELAKEAITKHHEEAMARIQAPGPSAVAAFGRKNHQ